MPNRGNTQDWQPQGGRKPMQTTPDDDEAQVADQARVVDDESARDEAVEREPMDQKRRALQPSQEREEERSGGMQAGDFSEPVESEGEQDDEADDEADDEDDDDEEIEEEARGAGP